MGASWIVFNFPGHTCKSAHGAQCLVEIDFQFINSIVSEAQFQLTRMLSLQKNHGILFYITFNLQLTMETPSIY